MNNEDILKNEIRENEETLYKMHLYRDTSGWWRGYELSAYFAHFYPNSLSERDRLKPIRKKSKKNEDGVISTGVKLESFQKYFPFIDINDNSTKIDDTHFEVDMREYFNGKINLENYSNILKEWKEQFKLISPTKKSSDSIGTKITDYNEMSLKAVVQQILGYPLESKTPIESIAFLSTLKFQLSKIML